MPNQLNFPDPLNTQTVSRPSRLSARDLQLVRSETQQIIFGTTDRDVVELWVYNANGSFAGHINLGPSSQALSLTTLVDQSGPYEILNIDVSKASQQMGLAPGRYALVGNFFRDEVGSESGYKVYISEISSDRTEVKLHPVVTTPQVLKDIYEFITPSVPRQFAKGLVDQLFGKSLDAQNSEVIDFVKLLTQAEIITPGTLDRLREGGLTDHFFAFIAELLTGVYAQSIVLLAADVKNFNVQQIEINKYIMDAYDSVVYKMQQAGQLSHLITLT